MNNTSKFFAELGVNVSESILDSLVGNELLKSFPVTRTAVSLAEAGCSLRDGLFIAKIKGFLEVVEPVEPKEFKRIAERLATEKGRKKVGETLVFVLESADSLDKAKLLGKIFKGFIDSKITKKDLLRLWHCVDKVFLEDLNELKAFDTPTIGKETIGFSLLNAGLVVSAGIDGGTFMDKTSYEGGTIFRLSETGKQLLNFI
jgi:hypothetical protein